MFSSKIFLILQVLGVCCGNWSSTTFRPRSLLSGLIKVKGLKKASEWMAQVQDEFGAVKDINARMNYDADLKLYEDQELQIPNQDLPKTSTKANESNEASLANYVSSPTLQAKLEAALRRARELATTLREQIATISEREATLKDAIANGRWGVSVVTVHTLAKPPRSYLVRDGSWARCEGLLQVDSHGLAGPKCVGVETLTKPDPCVFNSVTKYETIPTRRRAVYAEDDFLCLKSGFNTTLERYMSVPRTVVNDTCKNGTVRTLEDNLSTCGVRVLSEYTYYPGEEAQVAREYCAPAPGPCRLLAAWHLSNTTLENFEFLKDDPAFKAYFIKNQ